jgi:hypothetical protein
MPTEAQRRQELAWQAQQAAAELEEQQAQKAAQARQETENQEKRLKLRKEAAEALQKLNQELPDDLGGEALQAEQHDEDGAQYCGKVYLSRLVDFDDPEQAFAVDVPGENVRYSISWGSIPPELRTILKEYCSVGGKLEARTKNEWIDQTEYKLWVELFLK